MTALFENPAVPAGARVSIRECADLLSCGPKHIQVMHLAQKVLTFLEITNPRGVLRRQEVLHDVAEAFQADAQLMESDLGTIAPGATMQFVGRHPTFQCQMLKDRAARPHSRRAPG